MRNQKAINEERFGRIRWRKQGQAFVGACEISRKKFGLFRVKFSIKANEVCVEVVNDDYTALNWSETYESYENAIEGVSKRFDEMGDIYKSIQVDLQKQEQLYKQRVMAMLITLLKEKKKDGN